MSKIINTEDFSKKLRKIAVDVENHKLLMTNLKGTEQELDIHEPVNCKGFGRIRHFRYSTNIDWPNNPLPIEPACKVLKMKPDEILEAQVFQNAVCNWRCWYCYVPFDLLSGNKKHSEWLSPEELIDMYLELDNPPKVIDLSGGQPDLIPEWVPWMMRELQARGIDDKVYLWSDDNLSNDYFWKYLSKEDISLISTYNNYGKVCCFKGFDPESFSFNTMAEPSLYENQFLLMKKFLKLKIDIYAYVTLTSNSKENIEQKMIKFINKLQNIDHNLPLRTIPLEVTIFTPLNSRMDDEKSNSLKNQYSAIEIWNDELKKRFSNDELSVPITNVTLHTRDKK